MRVFFWFLIFLIHFITSVNSYATPVVQFNLRDFLITRCPGAKSAPCQSTDNLLRFFEHPGNTTDKNWKVTATVQNTVSNTPKLFTGQSIQLNGEVFWQDQNTSNGFIIGFLRTNANSQASTTLTLKCIKNIREISRYTNSDSNLPNLHWNLRLRAPSSAGDYYMFVLNARNISNAFTFSSPLGAGMNIQSLCNAQNASETVQPTNLDNFEAVEITYNVAGNALGILNSAVLGASYNTNKVFTQKIITVVNDECEANTASNVNWPTTGAGINVIATDAMCITTNRRVIPTTTRMCNKDPITGRATGWGPVMGYGCRQPCSSNNSNLLFDNTRSMRLPSIYDGESVTVHAGSIGRPIGSPVVKLPTTSYNTTSIGRNMGSYLPCWSNPGTNFYSDKSVTIGCNFNPTATYGNYTFSSNARCVDFATSNRSLYELVDYRWYYSGGTNIPGFGRFGVYEAVYNGNNPLSRPDAVRPNNGDRVMTLIDQSIFEKHIDLSAVQAIYRTANGGGLEITGRAEYNIPFQYPMNNNFAVMGMFSFVNQASDQKGRNLFGIVQPTNLIALLTVGRFSANQWAPIYKYVGPARYNSVIAANGANLLSYSFNPSVRRSGVGYYPSNRPTYLSMADTSLDQIAMDNMWEGAKTFNDCYDHVPTNNAWSDYQYVSFGHPTCGNWGMGQCRYCSIYHERSNVKFMSSNHAVSGVGNDWKMYYHPVGGARKFASSINYVPPIDLNGIGDHQNLRTQPSPPSIVLGDPDLTFVLHQAQVIIWSVWDSRWGGGRYVNGRWGEPFHGSWGWRGNEILTGIVPGRSSANNFFLDRQRTLENYYQYDARYWWSIAHNVTDSCPGDHWWTTWDAWPNFRYWFDPCKDSASGSFNYGRAP